MILIKIFLLCWLFVKFEPITDLLDYLWGRIPERISKYYIIDKIYVLLGCLKCLIMWVTLIVTGDIFLSIGMSFVVNYLKLDK